MVDYKRKPILWIEGTRCLTNPERGVYCDLVERMYALEGPLFYDERELAGFCNLTIRSFKKCLQGLIDKGKVHFTEDGKLTANHVRTECELAVNIRETYRSRAVRGGKMSGVSRKNKGLTEACASNPNPSPSPSHIRKKDSLRESKESTPPQAAQPPPTKPLCKSKRPKGTHLADDWQPSEADMAYARQRGFDEAHIRDIADNFRDHWTNGNGRNKTHVDWSRTWQTWIRRESPRSVQRINGHAPAGNRQGDGGLVSAIRRNIDAARNQPERRPRPYWRDD